MAGDRCRFAPDTVLRPWAIGLVVQFYLALAGVALINSLRTLTSHRWAGDHEEMTWEEQLLDSTNYPSRAWLDELWAPTGERFHATHHLFPTMPYHNLGIAHRRLMEQLPADSLYRQTNRTSLLGRADRRLPPRRLSQTRSRRTQGRREIPGTNREQRGRGLAHKPAVRRARGSACRRLRHGGASTMAAFCHFLPSHRGPAMPRHLSRRQFLGSSAASSLRATSSATCRPQESKSPNERLNIAAVGVANKGRPQSGAARQPEHRRPVRRR